MRAAVAVIVLCSFALADIAGAAEGPGASSGEKRQNNLVSVLFESTSIRPGGQTVSFSRPSDGWIFVSADWKGTGGVRLFDPDDASSAKQDERSAAESPAELMRFVTKGQHRIRVEAVEQAKVERLVVKAIPELMHSGLGYDPAIKAFGHYDLPFLKHDILPNVTTLIMPGGLRVPQADIDNWHRQGKRFVAEVGIDPNAKSPDDHVNYWTHTVEKAPFVDGVIIDEFIINSPSTRRPGQLSPQRQQRLQKEHDRHRVLEEAMRKLRTDPRFKDKMLYAYFGGSGKKLNQEIIGQTFVHTILDCGYRIVPERYLFEVTSEQKAKAALDAFVEGIADWEAKEPGAKRQMVIAFGLFSMPPGGINKLPNVDYHVWMDQQMNVVANNPALAGLDGLNWWTTLQADEETVRFVGKLYRHYAIEGNTAMLTRDPLLLNHIQNADFEKGVEGWTLHPAEKSSIEARHFPRYGRIEGRYMGLGRPADPEHIGDTFLWMKRSAKGPNTFSQTIKNLEPGRLYTLEMFSCDYQDLIHPQQKSQEQAQKFVGNVTIDGVEIDAKHSFAEMFATNPEPPIPIWITYFWKVFRAKGPTATLTVSDWPADSTKSASFGEEQTFNFVEIQPYHE
jgi:hypothetical protein